VGDGFFDSVEFRTSRPQTLNGLVTLLYEAFLGRATDPGELAGWAEVFRENRVSLATGGFIPSAETSFSRQEYAVECRQDCRRAECHRIETWTPP
jgi:hypothetical protein